MRRGIVILLVLVGMVPVAALAQEAPVESVGGPVPVYTGAGNEVAQIRIIEVTDPFEDWAQYMDPQVGQRYVVVAVEITNTGERPFQYASFDFELWDSLGRLYSGGFDFRSEAAVVSMPPLEDASMLPGETITGALIYTVPANAELANLVFRYRPEDSTMFSYQHMYLLGDLSEDIVPSTA